MNDAFRRLLLLLAVFGLATAGLYAVRGNSGKYGLFDLLRGRPLPADPQRKPEEATLPTDTGLDRDRVPNLASLSSELAAVSARVMPAVVSIAAAAVGNPEEGGGSPPPQPRLGAGVIVSHEGHVMTAYHVVHRVSGVVVRLADDRVLPAEIVGANPRADIAVLKVVSPTAESFPALAFAADSNTVRAGDLVLSFGNPFGLRRSVTMGNISAKERRFTDGSADLFQISTPLMPGDSGGPLVNVFGEIIGINAARYGGFELDESRNWAAVGIAVAGNDARDNLLAILQRGKPVYGYLGVRLKIPGVYSHLRAFDHDLNYPIEVDSVEAGSPAEQAGLQPGDIIASFDSEEVDNFDELKRLIRRQPVGEEVEIIVRRAGDLRSLTAKVAELDLQTLVARAAGVTSEEARDYLRRSLGVDMRNLTAEEKTSLGLRSSEGGVIVTEVHAAHPAGSRLQAGDFVQICNGFAFADASQLASLIRSRPGEQVDLLVTRRAAGDPAPINLLIEVRPANVDPG